MNRTASRFLSRGRSFGASFMKKRIPNSPWNSLKIASPHIKSPGKDSYKWMETYGKDVSRRLEEENQFCSNVMKCCTSINGQLYDEISSYYEDEYDDPLPFTIGGYSYYEKREEDDILPVFYRKQIGSNVEEIILDFNKEFRESTVTVNNTSVSPDSRYLAYTVDTSGEEVYNLYIKDLNTGKVEVVKRNVYSFAFGTKNTPYPEIYYTVANNLMRTNHIYRHVLGTPLTHDTLVYEESSDFYYCDVKRTNDGEYMVLISTSKSDTEVYLKGGKCLRPTLLVKRQPNKECYVEHIQHFFVVFQTSRNTAFDVFLVNEDDVFSYMNSESNSSAGLLDYCLRDSKFIRLTSTQSPNVDVFNTFRIFDMDIMKHHIILYEHSSVNYRIRALQLDYYDNNLSISEQIKVIPHVGTFTVGINPDPESDSITFSLSNPIMRGKSYQYNINNNTVSCIQELKLPETAEVNEDQFSVETRFIKSHDNQEIPTVFVTPKIPSSLSPILLSSYGCYGVPNPIQYTPYYLSLLKRGWSLGYPCIRGGGDVGSFWYEKGRKFNRWNSIRDLDSIVGWCCENHTVNLTTNSAGGIIVGSLLNQTNHPIQSVLFHVPFLLLESTINNRELPLTITEFDEWGNPAVPKEAELIHSICPYANLQKRNYPNMFFTCGLKDKRTPYYNTLKYINKVREMNTNADAVQVMRCYSEGHFSENDPMIQIPAAAEQLAFLIHSIGGDI